MQLSTDHEERNTVTMTKDLDAVAREARGALETRTRDDGTTFVTMTDNAPDWVRDVVYAAHGDMLPDDWRYACIRSAFEYLADDGDPDDVFDWADGEVDVYNSARFAWLASHLNRQGYCDEATEEMGPAGSITETIGRGQYMEACEVFAQVVEGLRMATDHEDDET